MSTEDNGPMVRILTMDGKLLAEKLGGWTGPGGTYWIAWGYAGGRFTPVRVEGEKNMNFTVNPDGTVEMD